MSDYVLLGIGLCLHLSRDAACFMVHYRGLPHYTGREMTMAGSTSFYGIDPNERGYARRIDIKHFIPL